jgi:hypothetical protein
MKRELNDAVSDDSIILHYITVDISYEVDICLKGG